VFTNSSGKSDVDVIYEVVFNACTEHPAYVDLLNSPVLAVDDGNNGVRGNAVTPARKTLAF
jgi:hypothetical protein